MKNRNVLVKLGLRNAVAEVTFLILFAMCVYRVYGGIAKGGVTKFSCVCFGNNGIWEWGVMKLGILWRDC